MGLEGSVTKHRELIYDVGMHTGEDTEFYLKKGFRVIGFEADPELARQCRSKFSAAIKENRLVVIEGAIVDSESAGEDKIKFYKNLDVSVWGTSHQSWANRNERLGTRSEVIEVDVVNFTECVERYGIPYYMKVDIEGSDIICLKYLLHFESKPDYISIESEKVSFQKLIEEIELLEQLGYDRFMAVEQKHIHLTEPPLTPAEGVYASHKFQLGASGLFGKELQGRWETKQEILKTYRRIFTGYRLLGDGSPFSKYRLGRALLFQTERIFKRALPGWYDTHAKHSSVPS